MSNRRTPGNYHFHRRMVQIGFYVGWGYAKFVKPKDDFAIKTGMPAYFYNSHTYSQQAPSMRLAAVVCLRLAAYWRKQGDFTSAKSMVGLARFSRESIHAKT